MDPVLVITIVLVLLGGLAIGWFLGARPLALLKAERDEYLGKFREAIVNAAAAEQRAADLPALRESLERSQGETASARAELAGLVAERDARERAYAEKEQLLIEAKDVLAGRFRETADALLTEAQTRFLQRAEEKFSESGQKADANLKALLQPVNDRLQRYEEGVAKVESERRDAFGELRGQIEAMRVGQERVSSEAAKLVNALRNAPKSRGRWGEQQLRNVLETCGLSEHADFQTEVSVDSAEGRQRPDAIVRVPGGRALVIDAKVSLNAYQDAFGAVDEGERLAHLTAHANAMRAHVNGLGNKAYWNQFDDAPDYVIMFVPGEHFLSAALEHDPTLWDFAFDKRVLLATPTNLIAIARTVAAVWRQELLAKEARQIGALGKELYDRLAKAAGDLRKVGGGLTSAVNNYNSFVASFEGRSLVTARKLRDLNIEPGAREIDVVEPVEVLARYGDETVKLAGPEADAAE